MKETIAFACDLGLDYAKATVTTPLPATPLFDQLDREGRINTKDWAKYNLYRTNAHIYNHANLDWDTIDAYFKRFYRRFYFRPPYIAGKLFKSVAQGTILQDIYYFLRTKW